VVTRRVGCAILAAGASRRLGRPKQLVERFGVPLLRRAAVTALRSRCSPVAVVVGALAEEIVPSLLGLPIEVLDNRAWEEGIASSICRAARWAAALELDALVVATCDQIHLSAEHLDALVNAHEAGAERVASHYASRRGVPALFAKPCFALLEALRGDTGASRLLLGAGVTAVDWPAGAVDIDTPEDLMLCSADARPRDRQPACSSRSPERVVPRALTRTRARG
jgi:CTP:molybdopterin cytidylyltransferase MocA